MGQKNIKNDKNKLEKLWKQQSQPKKPKQNKNFENKNNSKLKNNIGVVITSQVLNGFMLEFDLGTVFLM